MMLIHTGLSAFPSTTTPSQPASFSVVPNRPPRLPCQNSQVGYVSGDNPQTLVLPAPGTPVAAKGPVMRGMTFRGSKASFISQSPGATASSQNMAAPMPYPPPNSSYLAVSNWLISLVVRFTLSIFPAYP